MVNRTYAHKPSSHHLLNIKTNVSVFCLCTVGMYMITMTLAAISLPQTPGKAVGEKHLPGPEASSGERQMQMNNSADVQLAELSQT